MWRTPTAAITLAVALMSPAGGCGSDGETTDPFSDHLVVSMGDSVASGEGNPDRPATAFRKAGWKSRRCHRSLGSGHALAAMQVLGADWPDRLVLLGCSGATIETGLLGRYRGIEPSRDDTFEDAQVDQLGELAEDHTIDAVLVSIGANDIGFSRIVQFCVLPFHEPCWEDRFDPEPHEPGPDKPLEETIPEAIDNLADGYRRLNTALRKVVPSERVIVVEYFDPTSAPAATPSSASRHGDCKFFLGGVSPTESQWARVRVLRPLNRQLRVAAEQFGWQLVEGVDESFEGHGICAGPQRWVVTAPESVFGLGIPLSGSLFDRQTYRELLASYKGTLHPNAAGHRATAKLIAPVLHHVIGD